MRAMACQITSLRIVYSTVYSGSDQRKHQKLRVTGICAGNSPVTGEFPAQMASNAKNVPFDDVIMYRFENYIEVGVMITLSKPYSFVQSFWTHWAWTKVSTSTLQMYFLMKITVYWFKFHEISSWRSNSQISPYCFMWWLGAEPATCHYMNHRWPRSMTPYGVNSPHWVKHFQHIHYFR